MYERDGIPPHQQRLIFDEKQLEDAKTLADYDIQMGAIIYFTMRLRGGMYAQSSGRDDLKQREISPSSSNQAQFVASRRELMRLTRKANPQPKEVQLFLTFTDGRRFTLNSQPSAQTVGSIIKTWNLDSRAGSGRPKFSHLLFDGKRMDPHKPLFFYKLGPQAELFCHLGAK